MVSANISSVVAIDGLGRLRHVSSWTIDMCLYFLWNGKVVKFNEAGIHTIEIALADSV